MFILTERLTGGVYAGINNFTGRKTVQVFEEKDDADRYLMLLEAADYDDRLEVMEVDPDVIAMNCNKFGYQVTVISPNDFIIPPV